MTDTEKQVLNTNTKLATWAGFTWNENYLYWELTDGRAFRELPNLVNSLDAQAQWLWSKLRERGYRIELTQLDDTFHAQLLDRLGNETDVRDSDASPAKACALCISKFIEAFR